MENQMTVSTISDELYDDVVIYKLFSNPNLFESLKQIENNEIFTALKSFCVDELQVCIVFISHNLTINFTI